MVFNEFLDRVSVRMPRLLNPVLEVVAAFEVRVDEVKPGVASLELQHLGNIRKPFVPTLDLLKLMSPVAISVSAAASEGDVMLSDVQQGSLEDPKNLVGRGVALIPNPDGRKHRQLPTHNESHSM